MKEKQKQLLIQLRGELVGKLHTQPFTIYTDKTIDDLVAAQPKTLEELTKVPGFPETGKRVKGFGEAVIAIFTQTNKIDKISVDGDSSKLSVGVQLQEIHAF